MSSALQSAFAALRQNDYATLAILTAVGYDYVLTFSNEIKYIWRKRWSWVSTMFIIVRYFGLYNLIIPVLEGSSFLPGPAKTYVSILHSFSQLATQLISIQQLYFQGKILAIIDSWAFVLFLGAADFVMILRIWAMYNRSRLILTPLLILFSLEIISVILSVSINNDPENIMAATDQVLNLSYCFVVYASPIWTEVATILQVVHGAVMCTLAVAQFVRQSLQMYSVTKQWQLNRYMNLLLKQGILYFFAILLFNVINVLTLLGKAPTSGWLLFLLVVAEFVPVYTLTPRFIISMRELYARDVQDRSGDGIDTAFGLSSSGHKAGGLGIVFADVGGHDVSEDEDEEHMEVTEIGAPSNFAPRQNIT